MLNVVPRDGIEPPTRGFSKPVKALPYLKSAWFSWPDLKYGAVNLGQKPARWLETVPDGPEEHRSGLGRLLLIFDAPRAPRDSGTNKKCDSRRDDSAETLAVDSQSSVEPVIASTPALTCGHWERLFGVSGQFQDDIRLFEKIFSDFFRSISARVPSISPYNSRGKQDEFILPKSCRGFPQKMVFSL